MTYKHWLIDGNNVMHIYERIVGRSIGRETLTALVHAWAEPKSLAITVFFDGGPSRAGVQRQMRHPHVTVQFSGDRQADLAIEECIAQLERPGECVVVTNDRAIQHAAKRRRVQCLSADAFVERITARPPPAPSKPRDDSHPDQPAEAMDVDAWLEAFGLDANDEPPPPS